MSRNVASPVVLISKEQQNEWKIIMCFANVKVSDMDWWIDPVGMKKVNACKDSFMLSAIDSILCCVSQERLEETPFGILGNEL